jgi:beta-phosphoglucomutase-like phosphatase (HAD superfamily)
MQRRRVRLVPSLLLLPLIVVANHGANTMVDAAGCASNSRDPKQIIAAVLFDLDGTLVDTESLSDQAMLLSLRPHFADASRQWNELYGAHKQHRLPWDLKKQILGLRGSDWGPIVIQYAVDRWGIRPDSAPTVQELWDAWESNLNELCGTIESCAGAYEIVQRLADRKVPMAIATSSRATAAHKKLQRHPPILQHMSAVVAGDDPAVRQGKPAPDIYFEAAKRLGVSPESCLVFEDALSGCRSGKAAGCTVVAVPDERFTEAERAAFAHVADFVLSDLREFDEDKLGVAFKMNSS